MKESKHPLSAEWAGALTISKSIKADKDLPFRDGFLKQPGIRAFTLLELIIALSIGTVVILLVSFAIRMGFFQVEKGSKWLEDGYRESSALHFFHQQATSMRSELINKEIVFDGDSDSIVFITPISLERSYGLGLMVANYFVEGDNKGFTLNYKEKRFVPSENLDTFKAQNISILKDIEVVEIVIGYDSITFQYLGLQEDADATSGVSAPEWKSEWQENSLPGAVKVVLTKEGKRQELIAPVMVTY